MGASLERDIRYIIEMVYKGFWQDEWEQKEGNPDEAKIEEEEIELGTAG